MADGDRSQPSRYLSQGLRKGPSTGQVLVIMALLPFGGTFLGLAGITLLTTVIGLAVATPLFVIFSPVLVPAGLFLSLVGTGLLSSGGFGLAGLSSFSRVLNYFRSKRLSSI